jgi:hypothetical protein
MWSEILWTTWTLASYPLRVLYLNGTSVLGFWEGRLAADICAEITGVGADLWRTGVNADRCFDLIERKADAFAITVLFGASAFTLTTLAGYLAFQCCVIRPIIRELRRWRQK